MKKYIIATLACILLILAYVVEKNDIAQKQAPQKINNATINQLT